MASLQFVLLAVLAATHATAEIEKRIIGGTNVVSGSYAFVGSLQQFVNGSWTHICGVTRRTSSLYVSAGHCTNGSDPVSFRVVFDTVDLTDLSPPAQTTSVSAIYVIGSFTDNGPGYRLDYTELSVTNGNITTEGPQDVILWNTTFLNLTGQECTVVGFGEGNVLMEKNVTVISTAECMQRLSGSGATITETEEICIDGHSITEGDSGAPLLCGGEYVGLASWSYTQCPGTSVFLRLSSPILDD